MNVKVCLCVIYVGDLEKSDVDTLAVGTLRAAAWAPGPRRDGGWAETHCVPWHGAQFEGDKRISLAACARTKLTSRVPPCICAANRLLHATLRRAFARGVCLYWW